MSNTPAMSKIRIPKKQVSRRMRWSRWATFFAFAQMGAVMLMWSTSTSSLRAEQGWEGAAGDATFGSLALAIGIGNAIGCAVSGPLVDRFGARRVAIPSLVLYPLLYLPLSLLGSMVGLLATGILIGAARGFVDVVANVNGVQVERHYGRPIMSMFHAAYPASGFVFGFVGSAFAQHFTESPLVPYLVIGVTMSVLGLLFGRLYLSPEEHLAPVELAAADGADARGGLRAPAAAALAVMIGFGVLAFVSYLAESATFDWGQEFVRRTLETTPGVAALAVTVFSGAQFAGRVLGDALSARFGQRAVMAASGVIGAIGATLMLTAAVPAQALIGFGFVGLGVSCIVPLMLSAAGRLDPENSGRNIGLVNSIGVAGMFVGPAGITLLVSELGIAWMPLLPLVLLIAIAIAGPILIAAAPSFRSAGEEPAREEPAAEVGALR